LAAALGLNCRGILGSCLLYGSIEAVENQSLVGGCIMPFLHIAFGRQLVVGERLANVTRDHRLVAVEQLGYLLLREPD